MGPGISFLHAHLEVHNAPKSGTKIFFLAASQNIFFLISHEAYKNDI
jgi:hypothetical protein